MCLCVQFWFVKNQTVAPCFTHKKTFTLENYTKTVHSYHVTRTQVHIITISHKQSRETNLHSYHVTHTHTHTHNNNKKKKKV